MNEFSRGFAREASECFSCRLELALLDADCSYQVEVERRHFDCCVLHFKASLDFTGKSRRVQREKLSRVQEKGTKTAIASLKFKNCKKLSVRRGEKTRRREAPSEKIKDEAEYRLGRNLVLATALF